MVSSDAANEPADGPEHDPVLSAPWSHRGTVEAAVVLRGGDRTVKRRGFVLLTGMALTAPAHQWLIHEPGPLVSGLSGRRVSAALVDRFMAMIPELRAMDDVAGGGTVLSLAEQDFGMIAELLDQASYNEPTGRRLHVALAELGQLAGWAAHDHARCVGLLGGGLESSRPRRTAGRRSVLAVLGEPGGYHRLRRRLPVTTWAG